MGYVGGSFAPPLDGAKVEAYRALAEHADPPVKDAMLELCDMMDAFLETPASGLEGTPHPAGRGIITPLEDAEIKRIWDYVPWQHEVDAMLSLFGDIPVTDAEVRNAAHHLVWFAQELTADREPLTNDRL